VAENFAIAKATLIIEALANNPQPANIADLASQLEMPRQTIHRILSQLSEVGLVTRDEVRQRFFIGARLRSISFAVLIQTHANTAANRVLRALVDEVHETCNVGMLDGDEVVYLNRVECDWPLRAQLRPGSRVPAYCTAIGKLMLAHLPEAKQLGLLDNLQFRRLTPNTLMSPKELKEDLKQIVKRGYSVNNQEDSLGLVAVAVPIVDADGNVVAGLGVHAAEARTPVAQMLKQLPLLRRTAAKLSALIFGNQ
jgi:IclR family transcriptional regulator, acetate operon repressor